jgi:signal transduction histidine kinase
MTLAGTFIRTAGNMSTATDARLAADIDAVARIDAVSTILEVVCRTTGMGFAAVARVTEDRWTACAVRDEIAFGLKPGGELKVETTICDEIRASGQGVIIDHVTADDAWAKHHTPQMYGFESYISLPIVRADGSFFGTLCAIDPRPAKLNTPQVVGMFKLFAQLVAFHLDAQDHVRATEAALLTERQTADLREQFVAVLGHDLRNPLASIGAGARLLRKEGLSDRAKAIVGLVEQSVGRMAGLIDNVMDLTRARLGGGLQLNRREHRDLALVLEQVVDELRTANPDRMIETRLALDATISCDAPRVAQVLSNLVGNALSHGAADRPVVVTTFTDGAAFELSVRNEGEPIAPALLARLFQPFFRGTYRAGHEGLGLGLYIAHEIVTAHGGTLDVASTADETRFTVRLPLG